MFTSHSLGRPFGIEVRLHGSVLLLVGAVALLSLVGGGVGAAVATVTLLAITLASVTLHELGHVLVARALGIGTTGVTLYPFGGLAQLTREARTPGEEVLVALAGPAVNVLLASLAALGLALLGPFAPGVLDTVLWANVVLGAFNLVPAYPMDGGRVLRGVLWRGLGYRRGRREATRLAARVGQGFALLFGLLGLVVLNPMLVVIAVFVFVHASAELARLSLRPAAPAGFGEGDAFARPWSSPPRVSASPALPAGRIFETSRSEVSHSRGSARSARPRASDPPRVRVVARTPWGYVVERWESSES